jgi:hypothetical protein
LLHIVKIIYICGNENDIPMKSLSKDHFISAIKSMQLQKSKDIDNSNAISKVFNTDAVYDNDVLVLELIKFLQMFFPKDENGFCEIEHYCFDMNFGKVSDQELITPEDLWDRLNDSFEDKKEYDLNRKTEIDLWLNRVESVNNILLFQKATPSSFDADLKNKFLLDEAGMWPGANKIAWPKINGLLGTLGLDPIPSTHPLIDDYEYSSGHFLSELTPNGFKPLPLTLPIPKQETIFDIIEREKEDAHEKINQNTLYGHCMSNERYYQGRIHALESIEKVLKSK